MIFLAAFIWLIGAVIFVGLMAWQIQRKKPGWVIFNGAMAALYLLAALYLTK